MAASLTSSCRDGRQIVKNWKRFVGLLILAIAVVACSGTGAEVSRGINVGNRAPDFSLEALDGTKLSLQDQRGKVVLINFWATWCPPCRAEIPDIEAAFEARQDDGFVVLGINVEEPRETVLPFVDEFEMSYPVLLDESGRLLQTYRAMRLPMSVIVDQDGMIQARHIGFLTAADLDGYLAELLP
jgi:cytochrome c biogenesis protein CcmG/thiol:disulfide interchange protein DsbE